MRPFDSTQAAALASVDRATHMRVKIEDADGVMVNVSDLEGEDWVSEIVIEASTDTPVSRATITLWRAIGLLSLAPLIEGSTLNRNASNDYAPLVNPFRFVTVEIATLIHTATPASDEWVLLWEGYIDEMDWGGFASRVVVHARDPMSRLNDTIIETQRTYGDSTGSQNVTAVMQQILDDNPAAGTYTLSYDSPPTLPVDEYDLANVSVLDALVALRDLTGWNLHWRWHHVLEDFGLTLWEPQRSDQPIDYTLGPDDYYDVTSVGLNLAGIRNKGIVVYTTADGAQSSVTDTRSDSVAKYGERLIKIDAQHTSIRSQAQADYLNAAILDDTEDPTVVQEIEAAFFWPIELGDLYTYTANDVHYDVDQDWAVFAYRHVLRGQACRTVIAASGKASGGADRWKKRERVDDTRTPHPNELVALFSPQKETTVRTGETLTLRVSFLDLQVTTDTTNDVFRFVSYLTPESTGTRTYFAPVRGLPVGAIVTRIEHRVWQTNAATDGFTASLSQVDQDADVVEWSDIALGDSTLGAWFTLGEPIDNREVLDDHLYVLRFDMNNTSAHSDVRYMYTDITYTQVGAAA